MQARSTRSYADVKTLKDLREIVEDNKYEDEDCEILEMDGVDSTMTLERKGP